MPDGAKVFTRKGQKHVRYKDKRGHSHEAKLSGDGTKILCKTKYWYIKFEDKDSIVRDLKAFTYEEPSKTLRDKIDKLVNNEPVDKGYIEKLPDRIKDELTAYGLLDSQQTKLSRPLTELVTEYRQTLEARERSAGYIRATISELSKILDNCEFKYWSQITQIKVMNYLKGLRDSGISYRRSNAYLQAIKSFCSWAVQCNYAGNSPLQHLKKLDVELDRRHERRALATEELSHLLKTTINSDKVEYGMSGIERGMLYYTASMIGLRANELRTLKVNSFDLDDFGITVEACNSKHRRKDELPIKRELGLKLKEYFKGRGPTDKAFGGSYQQLTDKTADMLKADLADAGIEYIVNNKVCDFHSLRMTFITFLDSTDASLKERMALARHSDRGNLTLGTYTDMPKRYNLRAVVEQLPQVWPIQVQVQRATGTDGKPVDADGNFLPISCFSPDQIKPNMTKYGQATLNTVAKTPIRVNKEGLVKSVDPKVARSSRVGLVL
jgi:integrase